MENLTDFEFYLKFTKPLILNLPQTNDRLLAAAWVKRLAEDSAVEENTKLDYLKLLLFVLQRKKLAPPFTEHPHASEVLEKFPEDQTLVDVAKTILETEASEKRTKMQKLAKGERGDYPPYVSDFSADLLEYVAVQNIDNFGVHGYYAISKLPLSMWHRVNKQLLPKAAKSMLEVSTVPPTLVEVHSLPELEERPAEASPQPPAEQPPVEEPPEAEEPPPEPEKKKPSPRKSSLGATPPSRPIGKISPPTEDREPPTWGSNLLEAKFLEEDVGDIATDAEMLDALSPTEVLWASPPSFDAGDMLDAESPFLIDGEDVYLDTSEPSFLAGGSPPGSPGFLDMSMAGISPPAGQFIDTSFGDITPPSSPAWTSAASLPYLTPRYPGVTPPPPGKPTPPPLTRKPLQKKTVAVPKIKQTRASLLLQKKKEAEAAPPPPPPVKKIVRRPSKPKAVPPPPPPPPQQKEEEVPPKKRLLKKPSKGKIRKKPSKDVGKEAVVAPPGSPQAAARARADAVEEYVEEYKQLLGELAQQQVTELQELQELQEHRGEAPSVVEQPKVVSKLVKPKRYLSRIAKASKQAIPKGHDAAVDLDQSIHISSEASRILEGAIEGPSKYTGIPSLGGSTMRHPALKPISPEKSERVETGADAEEPEEPEAYGPEHASVETPPGHAGKDPRLVTAFNQMLDTSIILDAAANLGAVDLEELDVNLADISGGNLEQLMSGIEAATQAQAEPDYEDFEAMERMVEEQMRREGQDPGARTKKKKRMSKKEWDESKRRFLGVHHITDRQYEELEAAEEPDYEDFEGMERMVEEQMRREGQDPDARTKKKKRMSKKEWDESKRRFLGVHHVTDRQYEELEAAEEPDYEDFEGMERMVEEQMRREGQDPGARTKKKKRMSKEEWDESKRRFLGVHHVTDRQYEELEAADVSVLEAVPAPPSVLEAVPTEPVYDYDDFEAMERQVEEEMGQAGQDPHARAKKYRASYDEYHEQKKRLLDVHHRIDAQEEELENAPEWVAPERKRKVRRPPTVRGRSPLAEIREEDEEEWESAAEYFATHDTQWLPPGASADVRTKPTEFMFPGVEIPEEDDLEAEYLPEEFLEDDLPEEDTELVFSPAKREKRLLDRMKLYNEYNASLPAQADVPVTAPRPTTTPERFPEAKGGPIAGLMEIPELSPDRLGHLAGAYEQLPDSYGLPGIERMFGLSKVAPLSGKAVHRPAEIPASPPHTQEEMIQIPTSPTQVIAGYPPETFMYQYESPERQHGQMRPAAQVDTSGVSPRRKTWYSDLEDLHYTLHGTPPRQTVPTVFDVPGERVYAESPPREWASPVSPQLSPPIDVEALRRDIYSQSIKPSTRPYKRRLKPGVTVKRYSHAPAGMGPIAEDERETPAHLTADDLFLREDLEKHRPIKTRRRIQFPYKHRRTVARHSAAPALGQIQELYETPPKTHPDVFDLPDMVAGLRGESPPPGFPQRPISPLLSPPIEREAFQEQIVAGAIPADRTRGIRGGVIKKKSRRPGLGAVSEKLEEADEDAWAQRTRILAASKHFPPLQFPKRREPTLSPIGSPVAYPVSPTTRQAAPVSPGGREGPRRRTLTKKLKKRKLDFSKAPSSPDEERVEVSEVQSDIVEERDLYTPPQMKEIELTREEIHAIRRARGISPSPERVPPGTPRTPGAVRIGDEEEPVVDYLPDFTPPSPLSEWGAVEDTMAEVKQYVHTGRKRPKREFKAREFYQKHPLKFPGRIEEGPLEEQAAMIHDTIEAEVEAEMAAQAAAERSRRTLLDEPVPGGLQSPLRPQFQVPFYESPQHLQPLPLRRPPSKELKIMPIKYRDVLSQEEPPEFYSSPVSSPRVSPRRVSPRRVSPAASPRTSPYRSPFGAVATSPGIFEEQFPEFASPGSPRRVISEEEELEEFKRLERLARSASPVSPRRVVAKEADLEEFERLERLARSASPASPRRVIAEEAELEEFERLEQLAQDPNVGHFEAEPLPRGVAPPGVPAARIQQMAEAQYAALLDSPQRPAPTSPQRIAEAQYAALSGSPQRPAPTSAQRIAEAQYAALLGSPQRPAPTSPQRIAEAQYAALLDSPRRPAQASPQRIAEAQYAALLASPQRPPQPQREATPPRMSPGALARLEAELAGLSTTPTRLPSPVKTHDLWYHSLVPSPVIRAAVAEAEAAQAAAAAAAAAVAPVEFQYEETVKEQKAPGKVKSAGKIAKGLSGASKPGAKKAGKSLSGSESSTSAKSDRSLPKKPKKKKYQAVSKLDTGRKKKKKPEEPPAAAPVVEVQYDLAALQDLGLNQAELQLMNLDDFGEDVGLLEEELPPELVDPRSPERPRHPLYRRRRVRPSRVAPKMSPLAETEEEHRTSPMGFDMRWHLSPQRRVDLRIPDVKVLLSPLKDSRYKFERVSLDVPETHQPYARPLPVARGRELLVRTLAEEEEPDLIEDAYLNLAEEEASSERADEAWGRLESAQEAYEIGEEVPPGIIYATPSMGPSPIKRRIPVDRPPTSPENLRGELEVHEIYDPESEKMTKKIFIGGKYRPLRGAKQPTLGPLYEGTPPKETIQSLKARRKMAAIMAAANAQYDQLLEPSPIRRPPSPKTPSPGELKRRVVEHEMVPQRYKKKWGKYRKRPPTLSPQIEFAEAFYEETPSPPRPRSPQLPLEAAYQAAELEKETVPEYYSPMSTVEEDLDIWEGYDEGLLGALSPPHELDTTPEEIPIEYLLPMPRPARRIQPYDPDPSFAFAHGVPEAVSVRPSTPPTPKKPSVPKAERQLPRRRIDFDRTQGTPPTPDEESRVRVLTVSAELHEPRSPRRFPPSPQPIHREEPPSFLEAISPESSPLQQNEEDALLDYSWGAERPLPEHMAGFKWLSPFKTDLPDNQ